MALRTPQSVSQASRPLTGNIDEFRVGSDLLEQRQYSLWFGHQAPVQVRFELQQSVVDPQPIIANSPGQERIVLLLAGDAFKNLK